MFLLKFNSWFLPLYERIPLFIRAEYVFTEHSYSGKTWNVGELIF